MSRADFEEAVADALDSVPAELARQMNNVVILVEDDVDEERADHGPLLGLYEGTPLTARGDGWAGVLPDRITIFRNPILGLCRSRDEVVHQVRVTVVHEIAHHFGWSDRDLERFDDNPDPFGE
jgi:predicted Zn-dependent protease with MMP-like domain